ncbi:acyl-CoA dehydrogenase family protein [Crossiella equi]|nr:acyl-CoA dehydrogenase family protein [Crossiella equi]
MRPFTRTTAQDRFAAEVRDLLARTPREQACRALGERGWLAPDWPVESGGSGLGLVEAAIVTEELALAGVPDSLRVNSIDNLGATVRTAGTPEQRRELLPGLARGELLGCVLYSEPEAGSDLAALTTTARREGTDWVLEGVKTWNVGADLAQVGVCAARTSPETYTGLSLFLVPMAEVRVSQVPGLNPEPFCRVVLDGLRLPASALLGPEGGGWPLITEALALERTGLCFAARARRWWRLLGESDPELEEELAAARLLAWRCVHQLAEDGDASGTAAAKWLNSELATRVAGRAWLQSTVDEELRAALREAPGLTLAAGTSEMMLATIAEGMRS